ncbi:P-loop containing nucleoside triphosphate hydrolase [Vibrio phage 1.244.A._10N.261.54.C3]|nr:P-loop containing nucleoside triphosphate hydrolase [Vibrio phage 1.244.A._10N.261.54.C3]AUR98753.1 P-loop containing nucleoside triphosphate hydrolase [Vibrio phage 1.255.O._10N.286.45.F1]
MNNDKFPRTRPHVNVGVIGHVDLGASAAKHMMLARALAVASIPDVNVVCLSAEGEKDITIVADGDTRVIGLDDIYLLATRWRAKPFESWMSADIPDIENNPFKSKHDMRQRNRRTQAAFNNIQNKKHFKGKHK